MFCQHDKQKIQPPKQKVVLEDTGTVTTMDITAEWGDTLRPGRILSYLFYDTVFVQSLAEFDMILHLSNLIFDPCRPLSCYSASATSVISGEFFSPLFRIVFPDRWPGNRGNSGHLRQGGGCLLWQGGKSCFSEKYLSSLSGGSDCVKQFQQ